VSVKRAGRGTWDNGDLEEEVFVQIGVQLAHAGRLARAGAVRRAASAAEAVGFDSVWVREGGPAPSDALDPLGVLAYAAAVTERVRLGASVPVAPWYRPASFARMLTTIDQLSDGRLVVGVGASSPGEDDPRLEETLDLLEALWGATQPEPVARRRPRVLLTGADDDTFAAVARRADGWNPRGLALELLAPSWQRICEDARAQGRDPDALSLVVGVDVVLDARPVSGPRTSYHGDVDQVAGDLLATAAAGAHEVVLGLAGDPSIDESLDAYARLAEALNR
jgi:alkanesulfonate monooxygenase SsuD/methylene tetrahydromethanopterin reductase-like flavin-dependent oxidoreductase (luciferase family)